MLNLVAELPGICDPQLVAALAGHLRRLWAGTRSLSPHSNRPPAASLTSQGRTSSSACIGEPFDAVRGQPVSGWQNCARVRLPMREHMEAALTELFIRRRAP